MSKKSSADQSYWADYDGLQKAKHQLLTRYLAGWFPILSSWNGQVIYIDCHAGRGRHRTGHRGSPVLALRTLMNHNHRSKILASTNIRFAFFEVDHANYECLNRDINSLGKLPPSVKVSSICSDYEKELWTIARDLKQRGQQLAPAFAFLDPYGFTLSMDLLNELLDFPKCELLINFMYRYVDMAIRNPTQADNLDALFGCSDWRGVAKIDDYDVRTKKVLSLFSSQLNAQFVTHLRMRASNGVLKYVLFHATNDRRGREVMKEAIWSVTPDGSFEAFEHHNPNQLVLIQPEPDLKRLKELLWDEFAGEKVKISELYGWLLDTMYRKVHLHRVLRKCRDQGNISFSDYDGRFAFSKNPTAHFSSVLLPEYRERRLF
jgi:three-Cys-motif partner protein